MKRSTLCFASVSAVTTAFLLVACGGDTIGDTIVLPFPSDGGPTADATTPVADASNDATVTTDASGDDASPGTDGGADAAQMDAAPAASCTDGVKNGSETGIDCGGSCTVKCASGMGCASNADCATNACNTSSHLCVAASCTDGVQDGDETGTDCGGSCAPGATCGTGIACKVAADCTSLDCANGACVAATCSDGIVNEGETGTDTPVAPATNTECGGASCPACPDTATCDANTDCVDKVCTIAMGATSGICAAPTCNDGAQNGTEKGIDCGGSCTTGCAGGTACSVTTDCASKICTGGTCTTANCMDGQQNGNETGTDCGGGTCDACGLGSGCKVDGDCITADTCTNNVCTAAVSCAAILAAHPTAANGAYAIQPAGVAAAFAAYCDMSGLGGGWTLVLKTSGATSADTNTATFRYNDPLWTSTDLLPAVPGTPDLTVGDAKYPGYLSMPVKEVRGQLDGYDFTQVIAGTSLQSIMANPPTVTAPVDATMATYPTSFPDVPDALNIESDPNFEAQTNCRVFGIGVDFPYAHARFGFTGNNEGDCTSNDNANGFGLEYTAGSGGALGSGFLCQSGPCSQGTTVTGAAPLNRVGAAGYIWIK